MNVKIANKLGPLDITEATFTPTRSGRDGFVGVMSYIISGAQRNGSIRVFIQDNRVNLEFPFFVTKGNASQKSVRYYNPLTPEATKQIKAIARELLVLEGLLL